MERAHSSGGSGGHHSHPAHRAPGPPGLSVGHSRLEGEVVVLGVWVLLPVLELVFWLLLELVRAVWLAVAPPPGPPYQAGR